MTAGRKSVVRGVSGGRRNSVARAAAAAAALSESSDGEEGEPLEILTSFCHDHFHVVIFCILCRLTGRFLCVCG